MFSLSSTLQRTHSLAAFQRVEFHSIPNIFSLDATFFYWRSWRSKILRCCDRHRRFVRTYMWFDSLAAVEYRTRKKP